VKSNLVNFGVSKTAILTFWGAQNLGIWNFLKNPNSEPPKRPKLQFLAP